MSTLVSNVYPFTEKIHKDFQSNLLHENLDLSYSMMGKNIAPGGLDNFSLLNSAQLVGAWASQRPVNAPRRNSTSSMSPIAATRNRMNMSALTSAANVIPESSATTLSAAASILNSLSEERFRGRAYSEGASSLSGDNQLPPQQQQPIASSRYKTELCRPFEENGKCKYGDKCQFAHGKQELRQLIRHPKYKTELCRTFHTSGFCPYGPRCHFIHNQDDSARSGNAAMQPPVSNASIHHQQAPHVNAYNNGLMAAPGLPIPIPAPQTPDRHLYDRRPGRLNVLSKQLSAGPTFGSLSYSPTSQGSPNHSPTYFPGGMHGSALMSPTSPNSASNGSMFTFNNVQPTVGPGTIMSSMPYEAVQQSTPPLSNFELFQSQGALFEHQGDDGAFDAPPTPPDSDRESMTGSPSGKQRLPIFRCLSQSE